jgi:RNAse (barnase) inhibitor barstar
MTLGELTVHFATDEQAASLRADEAYIVTEISGNPELLFGELSRALEFPDYFGHNWDAVDECIRDVDTDRPMVLLVRNAAVHWQSQSDHLATLADVWLTATAERGADLHLVFVW